MSETTNNVSLSPLPVPALEVMTEQPGSSTDHLAAKAHKAERRRERARAKDRRRSAKAKKAAHRAAAEHAARKAARQSAKDAKKVKTAKKGPKRPAALAPKPPKPAKTERHATRVALHLDAADLVESEVVLSTPPLRTP
jgi:hypothetical protein